MSHLTPLTPLASVALTVFLVAATGSGQDDRKPLTPKEAFGKIAEAAQRPDTPDFRGVFSADAFGRTRGVQQDAMRRDLATLLEKAQLLEVRQKGAEAIVTFGSNAERAKQEFHELQLRLESSDWLIKNARTHTVAGPGLQKRRGKKPAKARMLARAENGSYGASAYSFAYVTGDPAMCKNRMDVWYCQHGDFHASHKIADLGKVKFDKVTGVPLAADWKRWANVHKGHTYVVHCKDDRDRDFYVKFRVKKEKRGVVEIEWTLLTGGFGAPTSIHEASPLLSNDGADGPHGLCGGKMR